MSTASVSPVRLARRGPLPSGTRETTFVLTSRAPYAKLAAKAKERGWSIPWYSSYGSDFNYDFQVTLDAVRGLVDYNYRPEPQAISGEQSTELPGFSCFLWVDLMIMGQSGPHLAKPAHDHGARRRVRSQCRLA